MGTNQRGFVSPSVTTTSKNRSIKAQALLDRLKIICDAGKTIFGHHDAWAYGKSHMGWEQSTNGTNIATSVLNVTPDVNECLNNQDKVAMLGWDIGDIELGGSKLINNVNKDYIPYMINLTTSFDYVNTICWHCRNPFNDSSPNSRVDNRSAVKDIINKSGYTYTNFISYLNKVVAFFQNPLIKNTPIIFRPFHESNCNLGNTLAKGAAEGGFWWDAAGYISATEKLEHSNNFKLLWKFTIDHLRSNGIDNLLYAFSLNNSNNLYSELQQYYPGNDYVDIIGFDDYQKVEYKMENGKEVEDLSNSYYYSSVFKNRVNNECNVIIDFAKKQNKIPAITEIGASELKYFDWSRKIEDKNWFTKVLKPSIFSKNLAYIMLWRNAVNHPKKREYYCPFPLHNSLEDFKTIYKDPKLIFVTAIRRMKLNYAKIEDFDKDALSKNFKHTIL
jgi:mannan endo-1,4-beta-mannosidase